MSELDLGNVPLVKIFNCPVPVDPLSSIFSAIGVNVSNIERLDFQYVPRDSEESLKGETWEKDNILIAIDSERMEY